jgi:SAM-dependent methyltransferase
MLRIDPILSFIKWSLDISGPFKEGSGFGDKLYSSYTLPELNQAPFFKNTLDRLKMFGIDKDLSGKTVLDLGSHVGAISFELARRGAKVLGVEHNIDRVKLCKKIACHFKLNAEFIVADMENLELPKFDIVLAMIVDHYVKDKERFYQFIADHMVETCFYESNDLKFDMRRFVEAFDRNNIHVKDLGTSKKKTDTSTSMAMRIFTLTSKM